MMELEIENKNIELNISNVNSILEIIKDYPEDYRIFNSNFNIEATKYYELREFEPITYVSIDDNIVDFSWNIHHTPLDNKTFKEQISKCDIYQGLKRDVEDGYIFKNYKNIIIREDLKSIVLC